MTDSLRNRRRPRVELRRVAIGGHDQGGLLGQLFWGWYRKVGNATAAKRGGEAHVGWARDVGTRTMTFRVRHVDVVALNQYARREPTRGQMADYLGLLGVDHADSICSGFGHQQPAGGFVICEPDRQHAAQILETWNTNGNFGSHFVRLRVDHRDRVIVAVRNEDAI